MCKINSTLWFIIGEEKEKKKERKKGRGKKCGVRSIGVRKSRKRGNGRSKSR